MAKKKIKDLTMKEAEKICDSRYICNKCPLSVTSGYYTYCMKKIILNYKEFLEQEVEVEE